jgi:hypothetical protein
MRYFMRPSKARRERAIARLSPGIRGRCAVAVGDDGAWACSSAFSVIRE